MEPKELSEKVREEFIKMISAFENVSSQRFGGEYGFGAADKEGINATLNMIVPREYDIIRRNLPNIRPYNHFKNPLPAGTYFRAEIFRNNICQEEYIALIIESCGEAGLFRICFDTNDNDIVEKTPSFEWEELG